MKAWLLEAFEGLHHLRLADIPDPVASKGESLLAVHYAALNPADRYLSQGEYPAKPPLPQILGRDGVGTIVSSDGRSEVRAILRGEVGVERPGTFAQKVAVPNDLLIPLPPGWSEQETAGAPLVYLTAYQALTQWSPAPKGNVLVSGASGGVGVASIQLARAMGCSVVALTRGLSKYNALKQIGADLVLDASTDEWLRELKHAIGAKSIHLAIDNIGGPLFPQIIAAMAPNGRVSVVGQLAGPVPNFATASLFFRRLQIGGVAVGTYDAEAAQAAWREILELLDKTSARPLVDSVFAFEELPAAFARLEQGPIGKVLLDVGAGGQSD